VLKTQQTAVRYNYYEHFAMVRGLERLKINGHDLFNFAYAYAYAYVVEQLLERKYSAQI